MLTNKRRLVMEDLGFKPSSMFTEKQISKMRSMKAEGSLGSGGKSKFGTLPDVASFHCYYTRERKVLL
jgi:hypothetical protein